MRYGSWNSLYSNFDTQSCILVLQQESGDEHPYVFREKEDFSQNGSLMYLKNLILNSFIYSFLIPPNPSVP